MNDNTKYPLVSVVMSVYNGGEYLRESIESILNQTYSNLEFIIIDDGSTDATLQIIKSYKDPRIHIVSRANKGLVKSLNEGISVARGELIARQDADDISAIDRIEHQVNFLLNHNEYDLVCCNIDTIPEKQNQQESMIYFDTNLYQTDYLELSLLKLNPIAHGSVLMRRSTLVNVGCYDEEWWPVEDYELWTRVAQHGRLAKIPLKLYKFRLNQDGISQRNLDTQTSKAQALQRQLCHNWLPLLRGRHYVPDYLSLVNLIKIKTRNKEFLQLIRILKHTRVQKLSESKKKIVIITSATSRGGGEYYVDTLINGLKDRFDFYVLGRHKLLKNFDTGASQHRMPEFIFLYGLSFRGSYRIKKTLFRFYWYVKINKLEPDVVHIQQMEDFIIGAIPGNIPTILTMHTRLELVDENKQNIFNTLAKLNKIIAVAKCVEKDLLKYGIPRANLSYIANGINPHELESLDIRRQRSEIIWAGRLEGKDKNPELFFEIAKASLMQKSSNLRFHIFGEGSLYNKLNKMAMEPKSNITLTKFTSNKKDLYKNATALCITSRSEAMPLVLLEALFAGVPVVSTDVGDVATILETSQAGAVIKDAKPRNFLTALEDIINNQNRYIEVAKNGRVYALKNHTDGQMCKNIVAVYLEVMV